VIKYCICGHEHYEDSHCKEFYDADEDYYGPCKCQIFQLDNLKLIEDIAKKRKLV
jgi:hypothetical protein